jgi:flagella basal body P-ring formation protein FlgA
MKRLALMILLFAAPALADTGFSIVAPAFADAAGVRIVVPAHDIARGDVIAESDLTYAMVDGSALMSGIVTSMNTLAGMQTRRMLRMGEGLRADDVRHPIVVTKGQTVTMLFSAPGVELTATGRAMSEGGVGDTVTVQNPVSYRMIIATVTAPGTVRSSGGQSAITARK